MNQVHPNTVRQLCFLGVILLLLYVIWQETAFMFSAMLGALTFWVLMRKSMKKLVTVYHWPRFLAALVLMIISLVIIVLPFAWITSILIDRFYPLISSPALVTAYLERIHAYLQQQVGVDMLNTQNTGNIVRNITAYVPMVVGSAIITFSNLIILYFILYFMLVKYDVLETWIGQVLPLKRGNRETLLKEMQNLVMSNAVSIPLLALLQGVVALIGYMIFGVGEPVLWGIVTGLCSVIPFVGTMTAWLPISLYLFATGNVATGIWIIVWGFLVISFTDNMLRVMLQRKLADIHPLITLFGVIIGVDLFGFFGIIFGPLMISMFLLLLRIYADEFGENATEEIYIVKNAKDFDQHDLM